MSLWRNELIVSQCPECRTYAIVMDEKMLDTSDGRSKCFCMKCATVFEPRHLDKQLKQPMKGSDLSKYMKNSRTDRTVTTYKR